MTAILLHGAGREARAAAVHFLNRGSDDLRVFDDGGGAIDGVRPVGLEAAMQAVRGAVYLRSPGVPPGHPLAREAATHASLATTPTGYWLAKLSPAETVTITGTKGKSTATALTAGLLRAAGLSSAPYGNIGAPPLNGSLPGERIPVVEMSSFMLHDVPAAEHFHAVTNLLRDHLDWHGTLDAYHEAKLRPFRLNPRLKGLAPRDVIARAGLAPSVGAIEERVSDDGSVLRAGDHRLCPQAQDPRFAGGPLRHALAVALAVGLQFVEAPLAAAAATEAIASFGGLPSRQEIIPSADGRTWINDALATIPEAAIAAAEAFRTRTIVMLLGGADRGQDFSALQAFIGAHPEISAVRFGPAGWRLDIPNTPHTDDFADAITLASQRCPRGGVILFSPAAPSSPPYRSYEERAALFRRLAGEVR